MIVLDTNVVSELMKSSPDEAVWQWFLSQRRKDLHATAITAAEIHFGIQRMPDGRMEAFAAGGGGHPVRGSPR